MDYSKTFSQIVKPIMVRTIITLAITRAWSIKQLDVHNALARQRKRYTCTNHRYLYKKYPNDMFSLLKFLCGLKQAPHAWYFCLHNFIASKANTSLFIYTRIGVQLFLLIFVDEIILTGSNTHAILNLIVALHSASPSGFRKTYVIS